MSGPKSFHGEYIEGSFRAHQVPFPNAMNSDEEITALQAWLDSYNISEIIDIQTGAPKDSVLRLVPSIPSRRMGQNKESNGDYNALTMPDWQMLGVQKGAQESCMKRIGEFLLEAMKAYVLS